MSDLEILKELENEIGKHLEAVSYEEISASALRRKPRYCINRHGEITGLNLEGLKLGYFPKPILKMVDLQKLILIENNLSIIPHDIKNLAKLKVLILSANNIHTLPVEIFELKSLTSFWLYDNKLADLPYNFKNMQTLTSLGLGKNLFEKFPQVVFELKSLLKLQYSYNNLNQFSSELTKIRTLQYLDLSYNKLSSLPKDITRLKNLHFLDLSGNNIYNIPRAIEEFKKLKTLDLRNNRLTDLPQNITQLNMEVKWEQDCNGGIYLEGNPLKNPPPEIVSQGTEAVNAYFKNLQGEEIPLNEVRVLLVGEGGAGKTSLLKRLAKEKFDDKESQTHGINIKVLDLNAGVKNIKVHLWDFGGQEIMHATHQFFLSKRSLYILVLDSRKDEKTEYWLKLIESFGGDSPILVVLNKSDENAAFDVNRKYLAGKYKGIKGFFKTSCKKGSGLKMFLDKFSQELLNVELLQTTWPESWFKVKKNLEIMAHNYISYDKYIEICSDKGIEEKDSQHTLIEFLNCLGIILHFTDPALRDTGVINPGWATGAVYKIINSPMVAENKGILRIGLLDRILDDKIYPQNKHSYIIDLMKKFQLCYEVDSFSVLIPDLLGVEEPNFGFDIDNSLKFIVEYDFLPRSVMPRLMVRMHRDIKGSLRWRTGVVLENGAFKATTLIKSDYEDKKIYIWVSGEQKRDYFSVIRHAIREINASFEKLQFSEKIPLPDKSEIAISYKELIGLENMGVDIFPVGISGKNYSVKQLLNGIEREEDRVTNKDVLYGGREIHLHINQTQTNTQTVTQNVDVKISINLKADLPVLQSLFSDLREIIGDEDPKLDRVMLEIGDRLDELCSDSDKEKLTSPLNKLGRFLNKLNTGDNDYNKVLSRTQEGIRMAQKLGKTYNKFAQWLALPQVPDLFLGR